MWIKRSMKKLDTYTMLQVQKNLLTVLRKMNSKQVATVNVLGHILKIKTIKRRIQNERIYN